ncbi:hypothetical protein ACJMK2_010108 [Sinanodonta woodiana]|uniref:Uncharacterized protein n=1 Tax=Sinanodonta woodiana TaxID=1069815 RepID=A0ABD3VEB1_SINWO
MAADVGANSGLRQRWIPENDSVWNPDLPYGGKVYLARRKKPDGWFVTTIEGVVICLTIIFAFYAYFYFDNLHFHITHAYAHLGYPSAQHQVGQRYLHGKGVEKHSGKAMEWFRKAADQGHPHASYNLAVGHMKGYKTDLKKGEAHQLVQHAAEHGVPEAHRVLSDVCARGGCK